LNSIIAYQIRHGNDTNSVSENLTSKDSIIHSTACINRHIHMRTRLYIYAHARTHTHIHRTTDYEDCAQHFNNTLHKTFVVVIQY